jgi:hypothetical protein
MQTIQLQCKLYNCNANYTTAMQMFISTKNVLETTVIILNANFIDVKEISLTKTKKKCVLYSFLYNKKVYNLIMADIEAETCRC